VQAGSITLSGVTSNTASITSVDLNNTLLFFLGNSASTTSPDQALAFIELTDSTTVTAFRVSATGTVIVNYAVVELWPGFIRRVQRGKIDIVGGASATASITSVNTAKAWVFYLGARVGTDQLDRALCRLELTNSTTVTATKANALSDATVGYQVVELY